MTVATIVSGIAAAVAAYYARETARVVFEIEQERLGYEKNKYSSDMYQRYVDFIRGSAPLIPCMKAVKDLSKDEFRTLWMSPEDFRVKATDAGHVPLAQCLQVEADRRKYRTDPAAWSSEQTYAVRATMVYWLNQLNSYFLLFQYNVGNKGILCENMIAGVTSTTSPLKDLLTRMNDEKLLGPVAHLKSFIDEYGDGAKKCPSTDIEKRLPLSFPERLAQRVEDLLKYWFPREGKDTASN